MRCPRCEATGTRVIDSRDLEAGSTIRRRRECEACVHRFTTYERPEGARLVVVKRDGSRAGVRPGEAARRPAQGAAEAARHAGPGRGRASTRSRPSCGRAAAAEVPSTEIGRLATDALRELDQLAYIRFASVYHAYDDIETLQREVDRLIRQRGE